MITIDRATPDDAAEIRVVAFQSWVVAYRDIFTLAFIDDFFARNWTHERLIEAIENDLFLVARDNQHIAALAHAGTRDGSTTLYRLYALPAYWRSGVGSKLLGALEAELLSLGVVSYHCFVLEKNEIGKQFYLKHGFAHVPENDHDDMWCMVKELPAEKG